jgi:hypothetical protein
MDLLSRSPQDHINRIYDYLPVRALINIGMTNKKFYNDPKRKTLLVNKLVDDYLYISIYDQPFLTSEYFCPQNYYKELVDVYFDRLKRISIQDLIHSFSVHHLMKHSDNLMSRIVSIQNVLSVRHFKFDQSINEYGIVIPFSFFVDAFIQLDMSVKKDIIFQVFKYILDLWRYAEKSLKCIYNTKTLHRQTENVVSDSFEFSQLFLSLNQILTEIFIYDSDEQIRQYIVEQLTSIGKITRDSKYYYIVVNDDYVGQRTLFDQDREEVEECSYYSNDYDILHFVRTLKVSPVEIPKIVDLGLFFKEQKCDHLQSYHIESLILATFIAEVFDEFMDGEEEKLDFVDKGPDSILDSYSELINDQLQMEYKPGTTFDQVLGKLFYAANFNYQRFKQVLQFRLNRWNGN